MKKINAMSPNYCSYMELILEKPFSTHSFHILHCIPVINICHNVVPLRKSTYSLVSLVGEHHVGLDNLHHVDPDSLASLQNWIVHQCCN